MKLLIIAIRLLGLVLCTTVLAQDHAPLPEQCIADFDLWSSDSPDATIALPLKTLEHREKEMSDCARIVSGYVPNTHILYSLAMDLRGNQYSRFKSVRMAHYLERHGEMEQFQKEDSEGKR